MGTVERVRDYKTCLSGKLGLNLGLGDPVGPRDVDVSTKKLGRTLEYRGLPDCGTYLREKRVSPGETRGERPYLWMERVK